MKSDMVPFRIAGNLYFVGCRKASSHLLDTGEGLILLDTGYEENAEMIVNSMSELGFDIRDVRYIIHSHGHYDHTFATAELVKLSGAKTFLNFRDIRYLEGRFTPDFDIKDGDVIKLGNTEILCLETPGHTEGTVSFFFNLEENGKTYRAGTFGGAGTNQLKKDFLKSQGLNTLPRGQFFKSIERLRKEHVDIFIGNHTWQNDTQGNYEKSLTSDVNPFIDEARWGAFLDKLEKDLWTVIENESKTHFINYAHRGASEYLPENTFLAFYTGVYMGANGIETDVHVTKDGVAVLFHDDTLDRVTGESGEVSEKTYAELAQMFVTKNEFRDKIVRFEDFLDKFSFRDITFAIELKQKGTAKKVADILRKYDMKDKTVITSFDFESVCDMREYAPEFNAGCLVHEVTDELLSEMKKRGISEICPRATLINEENVTKWHYEGFNVRAWGVSNEDIMKNVYEAGADGMTVNFPDKLAEYINSKQITGGKTK
ncbi:MAG: MBL fold metallo-hydrolase [Oscillospiraceae bacterium]|nr:MBL fold metallo-hydrolase [Oscillospiraceae bacterium]